MSSRMWSAALLALCIGGAAHGARPLVTEDADAAAAGSCEVDGEHARVRVAGLTASGEAFDLTCGVVPDVQANIGWAQARAEGAKAQAAGMGVKAVVWRGQGEDAPRVALAGALGWGKAEGDSWRHEGSELALAATLPAAGSLWHLSVGHLREQQADRRATTWGLAWELEALSAGTLAWAPMAELFGDDRGDRWFNAGLRLELLADKLWVDVAWARQLSGEKARALTAGFKFAF